MTKVASHSVVLPGVSVRRESERHYPAGEVLAHLLGYVSSVTSDDISRNEVLAHLSNYQIGRVGFEQSNEAILRGKIGTLHVEVNAHGKSVRNLREKKALPGKDLRLTVDYQLQRYATSLLAGQTGAAVLLDTVSGEALVCCSSPSFDPNLFVTGLDHATWDALSNSPTTPLVDRSVRGCTRPDRRSRSWWRWRRWRPGTIPTTRCSAAVAGNRGQPVPLLAATGAWSAGSDRSHRPVL